ncbi:exonuclease [Thalassococcus sp. CAU 1522]|uniref:Exonuclease n=1 Tax=Thalassococcus arenae TaxID=2851652 RepID=A0ABS6N491_9RHOB|nr:exonuclease [Thalassococcus arenae]MBV2358837.1 exonuclease [Thalassococcus arenae]
MTDTAIVYDCEFLTATGAPRRFWCGPLDPDPVVFQIGAVRIGLSAPFPELERFSVVIAPRDRFGAPVTLDPLAERLTGVTNARVAAEGLPLDRALGSFSVFAGDDALWSWGKDEFNMIAISCYVAGIAPPLPAARFGNAAALLHAAGVALDDIHRLRSNTLPDHFGLTVPDARGHDALGDARMVAVVLRHLMDRGRLHPDRMTRLGASPAPAP